MAIVWWERPTSYNTQPVVSFVAQRVMEYKDWLSTRKAGLRRERIEGNNNMMIAVDGEGEVDPEVGLYVIYGGNTIGKAALPKPYVIYQAEQLNSKWMTEVSELPLPQCSPFPPRLSSFGCLTHSC